MEKAYEMEGNMLESNADPKFILEKVHIKNAWFVFVESLCLGSLRK